MACLITPEIARQYPHEDVQIFYSTPEATGYPTTAIDNTIQGYYEAMQKIAQSSSVVPTQSSEVEPYSIILRNVTDPTNLFAMPAGNVLLQSVTFSAFDNRLNGSTVLEPDGITLYQDADLNAAVLASQSGQLDRYMASPYRNALVGNWQPNWFRPLVKINDTVIVDMGRTYNSEGQNAADLSIGALFPFCLEPMTPFNFLIQNITVAGFALQVVDDGQDRILQRFGIHCELRFRYK